VEGRRAGTAWRSPIWLFSNGVFEMFVRFLTGRRKGEIEEMKYVDAAMLLKDGRAEDAFEEKPVGPPAPRTIALLPSVPAKSKKGKAK
jgi:hypothetical protein